MRSFERSPYPPGCAVHMPGTKEKFGFSNPGPVAHRLAKPELCLTEETDHPNPRAHHAMPRYQCPDDREVFENFDMPEMQKSYHSPVATMSLSGGMGGQGMSASRSNMGMSRSFSLPQIQSKTITRLHQPTAQIQKLDDHQFSYYIPKAMQRDGKDKLMGTNLHKLQKQNRITMPTAEGTGFKSQGGNSDAVPTQGFEHTVPSSSQAAFSKPPFFRMSPLQGSEWRSQ